MNFKRDILELLEEWAQKPDRKPLILRGARQVGKTTAINMFSAGFSNYIYLNLELAKDRSIFREEFDIHELYQAILVTKNVELRKGTILLFIDEIQNSPAAVKMLRYFYEELKQVHVVAAGSLLEILLKRHTMDFPVGRVEYLYLYPLTFREFLVARQETQALRFYDEVPFNRAGDDRLLKLFQEYALIGGMPEAVRSYAGNKDITALKAIYESLMTSYFDDAEKYARNRTLRQVIRHCLESIPYETGNRIKFQGFGRSHYRAREAGEALRTIERAMLIYLIYPVTAVSPPARPDIRKWPKLQFIDTGLFNYQSGLQGNFFKYDDIHSFHQGLVAEHIVRQEMIARDPANNRKVPFWVRDKRQSGAEVDLVLQYGEHLLPVEIKAGKAGRLRSLHQFINRAPHRFGVRLYNGGFEVKDGKTPEGKPYRLMNLPYFLAGRLYEYLKLLVR
jgi:predicted AAA+ superfamily ATPase